jgi:type IV pilus assembly protein PilE
MAMQKIERTCFRLPGRQRGVTLIELMVVVVIIGILSSIAYPSYQEYVRRGNRAEARSILLENAQILQRNYTTANRFDSVNSDGTGGAVAISSQSPKTGTAKYNIAYSTSAIGGIAGQAFLLTATRTGVMATDTCGNLTLTNTGVQNATGGSVADCWGR